MTQQVRPRDGRPGGRPIIERPRLLDAFEQDARVVLLCAPAGYGKTTLLRQWRDAHPKACWFTADKGAADVARLATGLAEPFEPLAPTLPAHLAQVLLALANPQRQVDAIVSTFLKTLRRMSPTDLVVDDYQFLVLSSPAEQLVENLHRGLNLRLLIGSRARPSWVSARGQIYGDVLEIGADELAFTTSEIADVIRDRSSSISSDLLSRARGWPAVVGMAALGGLLRDAPDGSVSSSLFRFVADELYAGVPSDLRDHLLTMALLPSLQRPLVQDVFRADTQEVLDEAVQRGFVTFAGGQHELHPLIREFLLSKVIALRDIGSRISDAFELSLREAQWDHAFELVFYFARSDLLPAYIESAYKPLLRSGRTHLLEDVATFARAANSDFTPIVALIDAELALRAGDFAKAHALGIRAAEGLGRGHRLTSLAYYTAGLAAQLGTDYRPAYSHLTNAKNTAQDEEDAREALYGLLLRSLTSESGPDEASLQELDSRRDRSPTDLLRATTANLLARRYTSGFGQRPDIEICFHPLDAVHDPRVRTGFSFTYAYELLLRGEYRSSNSIADATRTEILNCHLPWTLPHTEWLLAACALGLRDFSRADRLLQAVERRANTQDGGHLTANSAVLRARVLLALQRPAEAYEALGIDDSLASNPAMKAEVLAMRALVLGVLGEHDGAEDYASRGTRMSTAMEVQGLARWASAMDLRSPDSVVRAIEHAIDFNVWDPFTHAVRAMPALLERLSTLATYEAHLIAHLRRSNDFDLARKVGLAIGAPARAERKQLSPREREILQLVAQGLTNLQIAKMLFISEATVKLHVHHILEKLGAQTRTEAARFADDV